MKKSKNKCKADAVAVESILIKKLGQVPSIEVVSSLMGTVEELAVSYGRLQMQVEWPKEVMDAVGTLQDAIEQHLLTLYFDEGVIKDDHRNIGELDLPEGLGGSGLAKTTPPPKQL